MEKQSKGMHKRKDDNTNTVLTMVPSGRRAWKPPAVYARLAKASSAFPSESAGNAPQVKQPQGVGNSVVKPRTYNPAIVSCSSVQVSAKRREGGGINL